MVMAVAALLSLERWEWSVLVLCVTVVLACELLNTSLEHLAKAVTREWDPHIANALDVAAAAVLVAALGAIVVGILILGNRLWEVYSAGGGNF